ncbi:MAG: nucleotidyltransferase domain-containing protein [Ignavibacteriae bacterium]|nr:MAG: nucleotidyltransferase domain-containing protein [Ignavibacteriota bacterium]
MTEEIKNIIYTETKQYITNLFRDNLQKIILYGSFARATETDESDIDIMILTELKDDEIKKFDDDINNIAVDLSLKYNKVFSFVILNANHYYKYLNFIPFYQNVLRDGKVIYGR